ncbi:hypothetical protein PRIPAC_96530 [Pristionchus pacificus]|uniref:glutaminase n=1 Tax=Pristionchus pacificus TaxID=54126 RepID=A0A454XIR8_PRIPA|nr:hypothetical protein PRIPAC_96530 [Pristionchus pacificus]|eukprot:PDM83990.1 Ankyrin repeat-containing protein [Pristionchus pacificus]
MVALPSPTITSDREGSPKPRRKLSTVQLSVKIQHELDNTHVSKSGKTRLSNKFRNDMIMRRGSIAYGIAQWIIELEKAHRLETERNSAEVIYEIIRLANDVSDISAFKIIKNVRKRHLKITDLPDCALTPANQQMPEVASLNKLLRVLSFYGILSDDPRLAETVERQQQIEEELEDEEKPTNPFSKEHFIQCVHPAIELISRAFRNELEIPQWRDFVAKVKDIFEETKKINEGDVARYIPQLARQNPKWFGFSMCTIDGSRCHLGDSKVPFCLQSVSKAFNYAAVSTDIGYEAIHKYIGHEPSGRLFNEICLDSEMKPHNPMINAGAIIVTSLIKTKWPMAERFDFIIEKYRKLAGTYPVEFNNATFLSERDTADRNYALAYFMKENKCFPHSEIMNLREELELYFQLCSLECNCETLSVMAATLANGGVNPLTYVRCMSPEACRDALSLMFSCGMYDLSGRFAFQVGLPAKSGVSGAIMVVIPSVLGMSIFSPLLDRTGNSTRGVAFCRNFIKHFSFHNYDHLSNPDEKKIDPRKPEKLNDRDIIVSLLFAVKKNNIDLLRRYYMKGFDLEMADYDGRTALHIAAAEGHYDIVKFLLMTAGVMHDPKDRWDHTPLEEAIKFGHDRIERVLIKYQRMEMVAMGILDGSDMSDVSDFSDSEDEREPIKPRMRKQTIVEIPPRSPPKPVSSPASPAGSTTPLARSVESVSSTSSTATTIEMSSTSNSPKVVEEEDEEAPIFSSDDEAAPMNHMMNLPPMIRRPSSRGLKR